MSSKASKRPVATADAQVRASKAEARVRGKRNAANARKRMLGANFTVKSHIRAICAKKFPNISLSKKAICAFDCMAFRAIIEICNTITKQNPCPNGLVRETHVVGAVTDLLQTSAKDRSLSPIERVISYIEANRKGGPKV